MRLLCAALAFASAAFAGQSLTLSSQTVTNSSIPGVAYGGAVDVEFSVSGWGTPTGGGWTYLPAADITTTWLSTSPPVMSIYSNHETGWAGSTCTIPLTGVNLIKVRYQRVPLTSTTGRDICQAWSETGAVITNFFSIYSGISAGGPTNGMSVGGGTSLNWAYIRMFTTNVAENAVPPATAESQTGMVFQWKFDGDLSDSTGNGYTGTLSGGSAAYSGTPYQTLVVAGAQGGASCTIPPWTLWTSFNTVSTTNCLTAVTSYADADASSAVTAAWSNVSGPATPTIASPSSVTTNVSGASAMGLYTFGLTVTAVSGGGTASTTLALGAVHQDSTGIVIPDDPRVNEIFDGPLIAFGQNPWGYEDERNIAAVNLQIANNTYYTAQAAIWSVPGQGTVAYPFAGIGTSISGIAGGTLNGSITSSTTTFAIHNAQNLPGLTHLPGTPTAILIGTTYNAMEMVRICSTSGTTGDVTLTACYDGRGIASTAGGATPVVPAQSWGDTTPVGEMRVSGTGTLFVSDSQRPLAPAGAPGPMGAVAYSTGSVRLSASSTAVTGIGTSWISGYQTYMIRVAATHASGTPFIWWAQISTVGGSTSITASRPAPPDVDTGTNFSYSILSPLFLSLEFSSPQWGGTQRLLQQGQYCESETACFATPSHDIPSMNTMQVSGNFKYSYKNAIGCCSAFGPNFYGTGLAERAFYLRSGYTPAITAANLIDDYWIRDPEIGSGYNYSEPLLYGGGFMGGLANVVTNPSSLLSWTDIRQWAQSGVGYLAVHNINNGNPGCNSTGGDDIRDQSYIQEFLTQAALFDADPYVRANWANALGAQNGTGTISQPTSGSSTIYVLLSSVTVQPGQLIYGTGIPTGTTVTSVGGQLAAGQISVTNGSTAATWVRGDLFPTFVSGAHMSIGVSTLIYGIAGNTGTSLTLSTPYTGTTGTTSFFFGTVVGISNPTTAPISYASINWPTASMYPRDAGCARSDKSFAVPLFGDNLGSAPPQIDLINGSTSAVAHAGTASLAGICQGTATGTITVTNGSANATLVTGSLGNNSTNFNIAIRDTTSSPNFVGFLQFSFSGSAVTLAAQWPGASGTFNFLVQTQASVNGLTAIGNRDYTDTDNIRQTEGWACTAVDATHITLNRPWDDAVTGSGYIHPNGTFTIINSGLVNSPTVGYYTQPFMYGILTNKARLLAYYAPAPLLGSVSSTYQNLLGPMSNWYQSTGYDPNTQGAYYTSVQGTCTPGGVANSSTLFLSIHGLPGYPCDYSGLIGAQGIVTSPEWSEYTSRVDAVEGFTAVIEYYKSQCATGPTQCAAAKTFADTAYGAMFGNPFMTTGGVYADNHFLNSAGELSNASLGAYKWTGFTFGMAMGSNSWPAIRQAKPQVWISWPIMNDPIGGIFSASGGSSSFASTVALVEVSIDGGSYSSASGTANWTWLWNTVGMSAGNHTLTARVTDIASNQATSTITVNVPGRTQLCSHTLVTTGVFCEQSAWAAGSTTAISLTFPSGHTAGQMIYVYASGCCQSANITGAILSNTAGYTWQFPFGDFNSGYTDANIVHNGGWYTFVPATTGASDTITITFPPLTSSTTMYAVVYSGLSSADSGISLAGGWGPFNPTTGTLTVTPGDVAIAAMGGAPYANPPGWNERVEDSLRPYVIISDQVIPPGVTSTSATWLMNPEGFGGAAIAFIPGGSVNQGGTVVSGGSKVSGATAVQ